MFRKLLLLCAALAMVPSAAMAFTITEFAFTVGKVTTSGPINLTYEDIAISNPPVPLVVSDVTVDTSAWSTNGDPVLVSPVVVSGFDVPGDKITISLDCNRHQQSLGFPTAITPCNVLSITPTGFPSILATPIDIAISSIVLSEQGTFVDSFGGAAVPFLASASGTGSKVFPVCEPTSIVSALIGFAALIGIGCLRGSSY